MGIRWPLLLAAGTLGAVVGLGLYTFVYARGASYLGNDPAACVNCHVMTEQYDGWHSQHIEEWVFDHEIESPRRTVCLLFIIPSWL